MNKGKAFKKVVITGLSAAMIFGSAASAFADGDHHGKGNNGRGHNQFKLHGNGKVQIKLEFKDLDKNFDWVMQNIARLASKRVFEGYDDGTFQPRRQITRIEAIIAAVRLMGLRDQAESQAEMSSKLSFKDADLIYQKYPNAVGYVAVALEHDLFNENDNAVLPNKPATRLWSTVLLIKALGLENEAKAMMNAELNFRDADAIPAGSRGYVALAVQKNLVSGYSDQTFKPNKPVTRAELAALLDRTGNQMPDYNSNEITGTVSSAVQNNILTLNENGQTATYTVDPNTFVFRNGVRVSLSDIQVGDTVKIRSYNNVIIYIEVTGQAQQTETFSAVVTTAVNANGVITLSRNQNGQNQTGQYTFSSNATIYRNGTLIAASDLKAGDQVFVRTENNAITFLQVLQSVNDTINYSGKISAVNVGSNVVVVTKDTQSTAFAVNENTVYLRKGVSVTLADLKVGDEVLVQGVNQTASVIQVTLPVEDQNTAFTVNGLFNSLTLNSQGEIAGISVTQNVYGGTQVTNYNVSSDVTITGDTSLLVPGHGVTLEGQNQIVNKIQIQ
ncbi:S-layer homology domain-containing protein [Ferviditalea candida]|uniref:S-layer homology domain-containing protein n=1 Tax=Ferviditalea candida TaxID=3108399 RepID=A0ABU5ZD64_9BACL|nr:S-layer homology domain-containing protein [Paenibacillaceae bacterium T2]